MTVPAEVVSFRNGRTVGHVSVIALQLGFGALFLGLAMYRLQAGAEMRELTFPLLAGAGILAAGLYQWHVAANRDVQVTLSPDSLHDNRSGGFDVPWGLVKKVAHLPDHGSGTASIRFDLTQELEVGNLLLSGSGNALFSKDKVVVEIGSLDTNPRDFIRHVRRFAPHVEVEPLFAPKP